MPCIHTTIHNPAAVKAACREGSLAVPRCRSITLEDRPVHGWVVRLPGLRHPIVCDTLTGLVAYHPADNGFVPYGCIMGFLYRCYALQTRLRQVPANAPREPTRTTSRQRTLVGRED